MTEEVRQLIAPILEKFGVTEEEVTGKSRKQPLTFCRFLCVKRVRDKTMMPLKTIGYYFGRDHSTMIHAIHEAENLLADNKQLARFYNSIEDYKPIGDLLELYDFNYKTFA